MTVRVENPDFGEAARALEDLGDRQVKLATFRGIRKVAKPLGESMVRSGAEAMPKRGGLSARVAASRIGMTATAGARPKVVIRLRTVEGYRLQAMDQGELRHPVFSRPGRKRKWVRQTVPAGAFSQPFQDGAPKVREAILTELNTAVDDAARKV